LKKKQVLFEQNIDFFQIIKNHCANLSIFTIEFAYFFCYNISI